MRLIKLDTTSSTNDFLKELAVSQSLDNFTVVTAENQTEGKGQMGAKWHSEVGKNLVMSVLIKDSLSDINQIFSLNIAVALSVISALETFGIPQLSIKWPNDIMSGSKKIGGILIENSIRSEGEIVSVAGIGLNVNQTDFSGLPKASSLAAIMQSVFDKEAILERIMEKMENNVACMRGNPDRLWDDYLLRLFKKGVPMPFENKEGKRFMGIIREVTKAGKLALELEDDTTQAFGIKEIQMLY